jgi:hypothetical protein
VEGRKQLLVVLVLVLMLVLGLSLVLVLGLGLQRLGGSAKWLLAART